MSFNWSTVGVPSESANRSTTVLFAQGVWMLTALLILLLSQEFSLENYFIISFIGFLAVVQVYAPTDSEPKWWTIARWVVRAGYVVFALIMYRWVSDISVLI